MELSHEWLVFILFGGVELLEIYLLFSCDEWKSHSSMSLVVASVSSEVIIKAIITKIREGDMEYRRGNQTLSKASQVKHLMQDCIDNGVDFVFENLDYGYVEIVDDGEMQ